MKKSEFVDTVANQTGLSKADAERALEAVFGTITETLQNGGTIGYTGFGKFSVREYSARQGRNPQTGEPMQIPARKNAAFKAYNSLKETLNN